MEQVILNNAILLIGHNKIKIEDLNSIIKEVCKEWAKYHEHSMAMPQEELINILHSLNELTFKVEIPS